MPDTVLSFTNARLQPAAYPSDARTANGKYGASKVFPPGCVIGRKTSDGLLYPVVTVDAVQLATPSASATAGTFTVSGIKPSGAVWTTTALAYNASIATIQTALDVATGVTNGVVASSAGSAAPMSTNTPLILTFSGTGYTAVNQQLVTVNFGSLTGATVAVTNRQPNTVWTITPTTAASAGHFAIGIMRPTGVIGWTGAIAYNASLATWQTALDLASGVANGVVATSAGSAAPFSSPVAMVLTFSGTGYANLPQVTAPQVSIGGDVAGTTKVEIDDTTLTEDGTEKAVGFVEFGFVTDASSKCFLFTGTAGAVTDAIQSSMMTMPYFQCGIFNVADLVGWRDEMLVELGGKYINTTQIKIP